MDNAEATSGQIALGASVFVALVGALALTAYPGWQTVGDVLWTEKAAAWAQAIFSMAAIAFGFVFIEKQIFAARKLEADKRHLDDLAKSEVVHQLFMNAGETINEAHEGIWVERLTDYTGMVEQLEDCARALQVLPALEIPGAGLAVAVSRLPRALRQFRQTALKTHDAVVLMEHERMAAGIPAGQVAIEGRLLMYYKLHHRAVVGICSGAIAVSTEQVQRLKILTGVTD